MSPDEEPSRLLHWWTQLQLFWPAFALFVGIVIGANRWQSVREVTALTAEIVLYRAWAVALVGVAAVAGFCVVWYLLQLEKVRAKVELSKGEKRRIQAEIENSQAIATARIDRESTLLIEQRQRLQRALGNVYGESDQLQQDAVNFIGYVEEVKALLAKRSKSLQDELPERPPVVERIRVRDVKLSADLLKTLQKIGETFPDLAGAIPRPVPLEIPELDVSPDERSYDQVYLKQKAGDYTGRSTHYKTKKRRRRT